VIIMTVERKEKSVFKNRPTLEGAGVKLKRVFGYQEVPLFDPFLLLDHFGSDNPEDYLAGFPWHPHRGIETVTYMLSGEVEHGDSIGNRGVIKSGDVQWMTAGSGIVHQEMPKRYEGLMRGFQLWVNLPAANKMMGPRYRGITQEDIPTVKEQGATIKIISGEVNGQKGPIKDLVVKVDYLDINLEKQASFSRNINNDDTVFSFVFEGSGYFGDTRVEAGYCILFDNGDTVKIKTTTGVRFLLVSGKPLKEKIAWGGPIVMNTQQELYQAFRELENGTFIKKK
jgi:redox-sensitive bicupin YhaK (pirin superfamily)